MADGKNRKEISTDIWKQMLTDTAFNTGFAGIGATGRILETASKKGPIAGIDFEKIKYNHANVDKNLIAFKEGVDKGSIGKWESYNLEPPDERLAEDIKKIIGVNVSDFGTQIRPDGFIHIENRHGKKGQHDRSMADVNDLAKIQYILNNYDTIDLGKRPSKAFRNSDGWGLFPFSLYPHLYPQALRI